MANEIQLTASLRIDDTNLQESFTPTALSVNFETSNLSSRFGAGGVQDVGTAVEQVVVGDATAGGMFFARNIDATNYLELGITSNNAADGTFYPFLKLKAGEYSVGRLSNIAVFARSNTASTALQYRILSP